MSSRGFKSSKVAPSSPCPLALLVPSGAVAPCLGSRRENRGSGPKQIQARAAKNRPDLTDLAVLTAPALPPHRVAIAKPPSTVPLLFTTGVSGTISGRRQPPAMPQGAPVEGAPMGHRHHSLGAPPTTHYAISRSGGSSAGRKNVALWSDNGLKALCPLSRHV